ncbi:MAG: MerR family transcriptional regulator, partial [Firmicutes bacterium]|nr:MerR family transcriptional regulator [Bacillota bacterium]
MVDEEYKVSELARLLDLTPETIRFYESMGIVMPRHDETNRYRYYLSTDFSRLYNAKMLRSMGFSLTEIKSFFYEKNDLEQREAALAQAERLKVQIKELERQIEVIGVMSEELQDLGRLEREFEITQIKPFWLVPFRLNYSYKVGSAYAGMVKRFLDEHPIPRYSYILKAAMEEGMPCSARYTGYSVSGGDDAPAENAIYVPQRRAMRFA